LSLKVPKKKKCKYEISKSVIKRRKPERYLIIEIKKKKMGYASSDNN
jgi:hypothetical protein